MYKGSPPLNPFTGYHQVGIRSPIATFAGVYGFSSQTPGPSEVKAIKNNKIALMQLRKWKCSLNGFMML